jgi:hypothetical protein
MNAYCFEAGTIKLGTSKNEFRGFDVLAAYEPKTPEALHATASNYVNVIRPSGQKVKGDEYTLKMAKADFNA